VEARPTHPGHVGDVVDIPRLDVVSSDPDDGAGDPVQAAVGLRRASDEAVAVPRQQLVQDLTDHQRGQLVDVARLVQETGQSHRGFEQFGRRLVQSNADRRHAVVGFGRRMTDRELTQFGHLEVQAQAQVRPGLAGLDHRAHHWQID
jgi:hypothetical protein